jgi:hypothetical protein
MALLTYVDSPFKLIVVLVLGVVGYAGYFIHEHRELFMSAYTMQRQLPGLNEARFEDVSAMLMRETQAETVAIFAVDPMLNRRATVRVYARETGRDARLEGVEVGLFTSNDANNRDVIALMAGEVPCGPYTRAQSEIGLWYLQRGVTFMCRASVPPEMTRFIGQVSVGWATPPDDLDRARDILTVGARALSKEPR